MGALLMQKQIIKQLKFAKHLLAKIESELAQGSMAYGAHAVEVQQMEVNRLMNILKSKNVSDHY